MSLMVLARRLTHRQRPVAGSMEHALEFTEILVFFCVLVLVREDAFFLRGLEDPMPMKSHSIYSSQEKNSGLQN